EELFVTAVVEIGEARVLEYPANDTDHANPLAEARHPRSEAADAANQEVDVHSLIGRVVERVDDLRRLQRVHLGKDAGRPAGAGMVRLTMDQREEAVFQRRRCDEQPAILALP